MKIIDLFSGGGGLSLGFTNAGHEIVAAFDYWDAAIEVYKNNFSHPIYKMDLSNYDIDFIKKNSNFDCIIGGPPCQDFSSAGKRDENGGRADLTISFAEIVTKLKPKYFVMENVPLIKNSMVLKKVKDIFKSHNYGLNEDILDASYYGVPQKRKRYFLIGEFNANDGFLSQRLKDDKSKKAITIREYFNNNLDFEHYYRHPRSYSRRAVFSIDEPSPTIRGVNRPIPENYNFHEGDTSKDKSAIRVLDYYFRAQIQTFPKSFVFTGSKTNIEQIIGNSVPVKLAEFVAKKLSEHDKNIPKANFDLFDLT